MKITIPDYRAKSRNATTRKHWIHYKNAKAELVSFMAGYAGKTTMMTKPAIVTINAYYKGKRHVDTSNIDDKIIVDGLIELGILKDDRAYENPQVIKRCFPETEDKLEILIREIK